MSQKSDKLQSLLKPFGLSQNESAIYLHLLERKPTSALVISKDLAISRTKVYALLDKLIEKGLVSVTGKENARRFGANSYQQLEMLVNKRKSELEMLESSLPTIFQQLSSLELSKSNQSKIMNYQGIDGLKTVTWNSTRAKDTLRIFELASDMGAFLDFDFSERVRIEFVKRGLTQSLQLSNFADISPWTNIEEFVDIWDCRYIDPKELHFSTEILVYNDVVAMYQFRDKEIFCVEIYNEDLATMQKNVFHFLWKRGERMRKLDKRGSAKILRKRQNREK